MIHSQLKIDYPANLPDALQAMPEAFAAEARIAMAVKLFEMGRLSSGMAAQLAGVDRVTFGELKEKASVFTKAKPIRTVADTQSRVSVFGYQMLEKQSVAKRNAAFSSQLDTMVCARHGHDFMG